MWVDDGFLTKLKQHQIDEIVELHNKWLSQRAISQLKKHSRITVKHYIWEYYEQMIQRAINEHNKLATKSIRFTFFMFWLITIWVILLISYWIYSLINI